MNSIFDMYKKFDTKLLPILSAFFIIRMAIPYTIFIFIFIFIVYSVLFLLSNRTSLLSKILPFLKQFSIYLVVLLFYIIALINTDIISSFLIKELLNALVVFILAFYWYYSIEQKNNWNILRNNFLSYLAGLGVFAAFAGVFKFILQLFGIKFSFLKYYQWSQTSSIVSDNNFYSLAIIIGIIAVLRILFLDLKRKKRIILQLALFISSTAVFLSASRRGILVLILIYFIIILIYIVSFTRFKSKAIQNLRKNTYRVTSSFILFLISIVFIILFSSSNLKNDFFEKTGLNPRIVRFGINTTALDYISIVNSSITYKKIDNFLWDSGPNKAISDDRLNAFPELYTYGLNSNEIVYPLINRPKAIPNYVAGVLVNNKSKSFVWKSPVAKTEYSFSSIKSPTYSLKADQVYIFSVYCFVSDSCNIDDIQMRIKEKKRNKISEFNKQRKGQWQKLKLSYYAESDTLLYFSFFVGEHNSKDFSKIKGYAIYAYPEIDTVSNNSNKLLYTLISDTNQIVSNIYGENKCILPNNFKGIKLNSFNSKVARYIKESNTYKVFKDYTWNHIKLQKKSAYLSGIYCYVSSDFDGDEVRFQFNGDNKFRKIAKYNLDYKGSWQKLYLVISPNETSLQSMQIIAIKNSESDFEGIKGHIIIGKPFIEPYIFESSNPNSGWQSNTYNKKIAVRNLEILNNKYAISLDKTSTYYSLRNLANTFDYIRSTTYLDYLKLEKGQKYSATIYCFVSKDFNGKVGNFNINRPVLGKNTSSYNLKRKGIWQKLDLSFTSPVDTILSLNYSFYQLNQKDFKNLKGYILLAKPEHNALSPFVDQRTYKKLNIDEIKIKNIKKHDKKIDFLHTIRKIVDDSYFSFSSNKANQNFENQNFLKAAQLFQKKLLYNPDDKKTKEKIDICFEQDIFKYQQNKYWKLIDSISNSHNILLNLTSKEKSNTNNFKQKKEVSSQLDQLLDDNLKVASDQIQDSILVGEKYASKMNRLYGGRTERWKFAYHMFFQDYSIIQKLIGNGFNYQLPFGNHFFGSTKTDYPHNLFLSAFLYSGLIGGLFYIYFLIKIFFIYFKNRKSEPLLFIFFVVSFIYSMLSSNSHFDFPLLAILTAFPFIFSRNQNINTNTHPKHSDKID